MSSGAYVPPHLRNRAPQPAPQPAPQQAPRQDYRPYNDNGGYRRDNQRYNRYDVPYQHPVRRGPQGGNDNQISRSRSMPAPIQNVTDEEIIEMFNRNKQSTDGPDISVYEGADVRVESGIRIDPISDFPGCGIKNEVLKNVARNGYKIPTPVQRYSIPYILEGEDLIVTSQTGSGKTAAFMLPVITQLVGTCNSRNPSCVCLCPTRELAIQIFEETRKFCKGTDLKTTCVFGGAPIMDQIKNLNRGIDIVIATPGRLIDILKQRCITLHEVRFLILDEADRMLDMGFEPQMQEVINGWDMPPPEERQTMLFSATFPEGVKNLARDFMRHDVSRISVGMQDAPKSIEQRFIYCSEVDKFSELLGIIREVDGPTLVFAERKVSVDRIEQFLYEEQTAVVAIHGERQMNQRLAALHQFTTGQANIMVATDVASRGLDISNVAHVINLDLPTDLDTYTHRIGRTGRAGKRGLATSFFNESNNAFLAQLVAHLHSKNLPIPEGLEEYEQSGALRRVPVGKSSSGGGGRSGYGGGSMTRSSSGYGGGYGGGYGRGYY